MTKTAIRKNMLLVHLFMDTKKGLSFALSLETSILIWVTKDP